MISVVGSWMPNRLLENPPSAVRKIRNGNKARNSLYASSVAAPEMSSVPASLNSFKPIQKGFTPQFGPYVRTPLCGIGGQSSREHCSLVVASSYSGMLPCFLLGMRSRLFWSISSERMSFQRVSRGSMTSSM